MAKSKVNVIGSWAFLVGVILAVVLGLIGNLAGNWLIALVIIGLIVGLLNVADSETMPFLMSGAVLIIASAFGGSVLADVQIISNVLSALLVIFVPATVIVAIKNVFVLAHN
ncbi:Uncharacterised protein [uncultured archaeon]|nr:Uncharacterised protein [uncultured archaeon]